INAVAKAKVDNSVFASKFQPWLCDVCRETFQSASLSANKQHCDTFFPIHKYTSYSLCYQLHMSYHPDIIRIIFDTSVTCEIPCIRYIIQSHFSPPQSVLINPVSYTHLRAHETRHDLVCRLL